MEMEMINLLEILVCFEINGFHLNNFACKQLACNFACNFYST